MNTDDSASAPIATLTPPVRRRRSALRVIVLLITLGAAGLTYARYHSAAQAAPPTKVPPHAAVLSVTRADLARHLELEAEFHPFQQVDVHAKVAGYVRRMHVDVGDHVRAGSPLAELEAPELDDELTRARAAVARSEQEQQRAAAAYDDAHLAYTRLAEVSAQRPNLVAQQDLDSANARDRTAHAAWIAAGAALTEAQAALTRTHDMLGYCRIVAPFDGVVTARYTDPGALLGGGTAATPALARITQLTPLRLVLPVPASAVPALHVGDPVDIRVDVLGRNFSAPIARMSGEIRTDTRTMHVEIDVENDDFSLAPGMFATATLTLARRAQVLALPVQVLGGRRVDQATVLVVDEQGRLSAREIKLGLETANLVEVMSGLREGDRVLAPGQSGLRAGETVVADSTVAESTP